MDKATARKIEIIAPYIAAFFPPSAVPPCACVAPSCLELGCPHFWYEWLRELVEDEGKRFKKLERLYEAVQDVLHNQGT